MTERLKQKRPARPALTRRVRPLSRGVRRRSTRRTNVQEAGVDEPDIVKTDGNRIVAVAQARVHLVALDGGKMTLRKTLPDTMVRNVFLSGERVLVFSGQDGSEFRAWIGAGQVSRPS